jgi:hypothetical protein
MVDTGLVAGSLLDGVNFLFSAALGPAQNAVAVGALAAGRDGLGELGLIFLKSTTKNLEEMFQALKS